MLSIKTIIMLVLAVVVAVILVPTVWEAVWVDAFECRTWNTSVCPGSTKDCRGVTCTNESLYCIDCVNGTTYTILKLVPMLFVALLIIVGVLLAAGVPVPGT